MNTSDIGLQTRRRSQASHTESLPATPVSDSHDLRSSSTAAITLERSPSESSEPLPAQLESQSGKEAYTSRNDSSNDAALSISAQLQSGVYTSANEPDRASHTDGANDAVPSTSAQLRSGVYAPAKWPDNTSMGTMLALAGSSSPLQPSTECNAGQGMLKVCLQVSGEAITMTLHPGERAAAVCRKQN